MAGELHAHVQGYGVRSGLGREDAEDSVAAIAWWAHMEPMVTKPPVRCWSADCGAGREGSAARDPGLRTDRP